MTHPIGAGTTLSRQKLDKFVAFRIHNGFFKDHYCFLEWMSTQGIFKGFQIARKIVLHEDGRLVPMFRSGSVTQEGSTGLDFTTTFSCEMLCHQLR